MWYSFFITTYGVWVPSGLFIPSIIIGCTVGLLYMEFLIIGFGIPINQIGG